MRAIELKSVEGTDGIALRGVRVRAQIAGMSIKTIVEQPLASRCYAPRQCPPSSLAN